MIYIKKRCIACYNDSALAKIKMPNRIVVSKSKVIRV